MWTWTSDSNTTGKCSPSPTPSPTWPSRSKTTGSRPWSTQTSSSIKNWAIPCSRNATKSTPSTSRARALCCSTTTLPKSWRLMQTCVNTFVRFTATAVNASSASKTLTSHWKTVSEVWNSNPTSSSPCSEFPNVKITPTNIKTVSNTWIRLSA